MDSTKRRLAVKRRTWGMIGAAVAATVIVGIGINAYSLGGAACTVDFSLSSDGQAIAVIKSGQNNCSLSPPSGNQVQITVQRVAST